MIDTTSQIQLIYTDVKLSENDSRYVTYSYDAEKEHKKTVWRRIKKILAS